jgi:hypothetical protein
MQDVLVAGVVTAIQESTGSTAGGCPRPTFGDDDFDGYVSLLSAQGQRVRVNIELGTYPRSLANQTVEKAPKLSMLETWYCPSFTRSSN